MPPGVRLSRFPGEIARAAENEVVRRRPRAAVGRGSAYFDLVAEVFAKAGLKSPAQVVTRSGCYLAHDSQHYTGAFADMLARTPELVKLELGLRPAIEVWAYVQSRPEPGKCLLTMGRRDVGTDVYNPLRSYGTGGFHTPIAIPGATSSPA
jgi:D-serine dehydratase